MRVNPPDPDQPPPHSTYVNVQRSLAGEWVASENLAQTDAAQASGSLNWIPQYGNYGGNGANDAWNMASNYFGSTIAHMPGNISRVYQAMYDTGRLPVDQHDWAYFLHDIGSISSDDLHQVLNDISMELKVVDHLIDGDPATQGYGYVMASVPFIGLGAAAYQKGVAIFQAGEGVIQSVANGISAAWGGATSAMGALFQGDFSGALNDFVGGIASAAGGFLKSLEDGLEKIFPVVLDFANEGPSVTTLSDSGAHLSMGPGVSDHVAWVSPTLGILALDSNHNGVVDGASEISFKALKS